MQTSIFQEWLCLSKLRGNHVRLAMQAKNTTSELTSKMCEGRPVQTS